MRPILIPAIAAFSLMAIPAFAQSNSSDNGSSGSSSSSSTSPANTMQIEHHLRHDLSKAGYTDIRILPGSFLIHAKDSHGHPTEMMVSPNSLTAVTAMGNGSENGNNGNDQSDQSGNNDSTTTK